MCFYAPYKPVDFLKLLCVSNNLCHVRVEFKQRFSALSLKHALEFSQLQSTGGTNNSPVIRHRVARVFAYTE